MAIKSFRSALFAAKTFAAEALAGTRQFFASLGAWGGGLVEKRKPKRVKPIETISEPLPDPVIARIKDELLSASLAAEVIERARKQAQRRKNQQLAILLTL